jgi:hypothetical protein
VNTNEVIIDISDDALLDNYYKDNKIMRFHRRNGDSREWRSYLFEIEERG